MAPVLKEVLKVLDGIAPFSLAEEWDNSGFQVGFLSDEIRKAVISLDPTIKCLKIAAERKAQLLLTHHPLIFKPLSRIDTDAYPGDVISEALRARISIVALHTNLDMAKGGINDILAQMIGLQDLEALHKKNDAEDDLEGLGRIGHLPSAMPLSSVARMIMDTLGSTGLSVTGPADKEIKKIAILGGAGGGELSCASEKGADLFITGDIRHHEALMADALGLALIDAGHFNLERAAMHIFADHLRDRFKDAGWDLKLEIYEDEKMPFRHLSRENTF